MKRESSLWFISTLCAAPYFTYFRRYTHSSAECFVNNDTVKNFSWTKTNSLHIGVLETLTGTPYRQRFFYRNGVPGRSGLLSPLGRRRFAACDCWMQTSLAENAARPSLLIVVSFVVLYCAVWKEAWMKKKHCCASEARFLRLLP